LHKNLATRKKLKTDLDHPYC